MLTETLPKTNTALEHGPSQKERIIFQPSQFSEVNSFYGVYTVEVIKKLPMFIGALSIRTTNWVFPKIRVPQNG